jgi:hypothetical protein
MEARVTRLFQVVLLLALLVLLVFWVWPVIVALTGWRF